jgi:hypothetical protein
MPTRYFPPLIFLICTFFLFLPKLNLIFDYANNLSAFETTLMHTLFAFQFTCFKIHEASRTQHALSHCDNSVRLEKSFGCLRVVSVIKSLLAGCVLCWARVCLCVFPAQTNTHMRHVRAHTCTFTYTPT